MMSSPFNVKDALRATKDFFNNLEEMDVNDDKVKEIGDDLYINLEYLETAIKPIVKMAIEAKVYNMAFSVAKDIADSLRRIAKRDIVGKFEYD